MKPATRATSLSSNSMYMKWSVKVSANLWIPPATLQQLIPQYLQYCRVEKLKDILWQISVGLNVPETAAYVRTLLNLPETASIIKCDEEKVNGHGPNNGALVISHCNCTFCHNSGAFKIEWTIKSKPLRKEFFALLTKSLGINPEEFRFHETDEDVIDLCCSCTTHLQTLTSLFQQLKNIEESFKSAAGNLQASIVKGLGPPSQKSWNVLREHVVTSRKTEVFF